MNRSAEISFENCAVIACGTLNLELTHLRKEGFLNASKLLFTRPGRHEDPRELEEQLVDRIARARTYSAKIIVVYGGKFCYINSAKPGRSIDTIIEEQGAGIARVSASHCVDMLAGAQQRAEIAGGANVLWLTPGWILHRHDAYQDWDVGKANENFPHHTGGAILLDGVGFWDDYSTRHPEKMLEFSDWMGIPIQPVVVSLSRLQRLLTDCAAQLQDVGPRSGRP